MADGLDVKIGFIDLTPPLTKKLRNPKLTVFPNPRSLRERVFKT